MFAIHLSMTQVSFILYQQYWTKDEALETFISDIRQLAIFLIKGKYTECMENNQNNTWVFYVWWPI